MGKSQTFPLRLIRWFLTKQIIVAAVLLTGLDALILLWLEQRSGMSAESLQIGRETVLISLLSAAAVVVGVSLFMALRLVVPLGRLIAKTQRLHRYPFDEESEPAELAYDEPGEWYDLERALNELGRDLRQKTIRLSREKTELRTIMSAINEAVLAIDQERRPMFLNSRFALLFGLDAAAAGQMAISEIVRSPDILYAYDQCLRDGRVAQVDVRLELGGGARAFQVSVAPLRKKHNLEIYGAVAVFHDITELKRAEQIRIEFVANVSHEVRTPLTAIQGYLQTVLEDVRKGRTENTLEFLEVVSRNVDRLRHLVDDLLDLSALQSGIELRRSLIPLPELTESVLRQVDTRGHQVTCDFAVKELFADEARVEQVLRNLLQNAVRYVPAGGRIEIHWESMAGQGVCLRVRDNGVGIALEHQARLFERFYRVDEARSRQIGGTGIGLSLVKHIMQRHGGSVRVASELGQGAEFICEFPAVAASRAVNKRLTDGTALSSGAGPVAPV